MENSEDEYLKRCAILYEFKRNQGITNAHNELSLVYPNLEFREIEFWFIKFEKEDFDLTQELNIDRTLRSLEDIPCTSNFFRSILSYLSRADKNNLRQMNTTIKNAVDSSRKKFDILNVYVQRDSIHLRYESITGTRNINYRHYSSTRTKITQNEREIFINRAMEELAAADVLSECCRPDFVFDKLNLHLENIYSNFLSPNNSNNEFLNILLSTIVPIKVKTLKVNFEDYQILLQILKITSNVEKLILNHDYNPTLWYWNDKSIIQEIVEHRNWKCLQTLVSMRTFLVPLSACTHLKTISAHTLETTEEEYKQFEETMRRRNGENFKIEYKQLTQLGNGKIRLSEVLIEQLGQ